MRVLHPFLLFALAIHASPVVVVETAVVTKIAIPTERVVVHVKAPDHDTKQQQQQQQAALPNKPTTSTPKPKSKPKEQKYFHEPGWDMESGHYDARYFRGKVPYEEHRPALRHLVRSYLTTFRALGVETWLAHGSLLGWWWNGRVMPWDYDLDVQVSVATLSFLGERYNRSMHEYEYEVNDDENNEKTLQRFDTATATAESKLERINHHRSSSSSSSDSGSGSGSGSDSGSDDGNKERVVAATAKIKKTYLLDVNPHHTALTKGNGANVIDARWIDTSNGMFIDITGLRERDPERSPGVWSCKNNHRYLTAELWPLRRTEFEGAEAWIPYAFDKVLTDEYGAKSLVVEEWAGHRWIPELREWVKVAKKKPPQPPKEEGHPLTDDKNTKHVVVYEEVTVEV
ncbi:LicD family-domain-containing protein [Xylaria acuta]|nr:LicD family-domain-containing protein [Xylaria acuta]